MKRAGGWLALLAVCIAPAACRRTDANPLFPLEPEAKWTYEVTDGLQRRVCELVVTGSAPVGDGAGFELGGSAGPARLGWQGDRLYAAEMAGLRFDPPLPLVVGEEATWQGRVRWAGASYQGKAEVLRENVREEHLGQERPIVLVRHDITLTQENESRRFILESRYAAGSGLIRQDLLENDRMLRRMTLLSR